MLTRKAKNAIKPSRLPYFRGIDKSLGFYSTAGLTLTQKAIGHSRPPHTKGTRKLLRCCSSTGLISTCKARTLIEPSRQPYSKATQQSSGYCRIMPAVINSGARVSHLSAKSLGNRFRYLMGGDLADEILSRWQTGGKSTQLNSTTGRGVELILLRNLVVELTNWTLLWS